MYVLYETNQVHVSTQYVYNCKSLFKAHKLQCYYRVVCSGMLRVFDIHCVCCYTTLCNIVMHGYCLQKSVTGWACLLYLLKFDHTTLTNFYRKDAYRLPTYNVMLSPVLRTDFCSIQYVSYSALLFASLMIYPVTRYTVKFTLPLFIVL